MDAADDACWLGWSDLIALRILNNKSVVITGYCPVDILVTDNYGKVISKTVNEIQGSSYREEDLDGDGELDDQITIPDCNSGDYSITIIPEPGADPAKTVSLFVEDHGETKILIDEVPIANLPSEPTEITVDRTPPVLTISASPGILILPNDQMIPVHIDVSVNDEIDPNPKISLISIEPNWAVNQDDVVFDASYGEADRDFQLKAVKHSGSNYEYKITYAASDSTGNISYATATITIPPISEVPIGNHLTRVLLCILLIFMGLILTKKLRELV
jgi:hypothetical protein